MKRNEFNSHPHIKFVHRKNIIAFQPTQETVIFRTKSGNVVVIGDITHIELGFTAERVWVEEFISVFGGVGTKTELYVPAPLRIAAINYIRGEEFSFKTSLFRIPLGEPFWCNPNNEEQSWRFRCSMTPEPGYEQVTFVARKVKIRSGEAYRVGLDSGKEKWPYVFGHAVKDGEPMEVLAALPGVVQ